MNHRIPLLLVTLAALGGLLALAGGAGADDEAGARTLFYNVTTDESWPAGMALGQAAMAQEAGYRVVVFLNVRGVYLASKARGHDTFSGSAKTAPQALEALVAGGAVVQICPMCMQKAGLAEEDLVPGIKLASAEATFPVMTDPATTVVSY